MKKTKDVAHESLKELFSQPHAEDVDLEYYHKILQIEEPYDEYVKICLTSPDIDFFRRFIYQKDGRYFLAFRMFMDYCNDNNYWTYAQQ